MLSRLLIGLRLRGAGRRLDARRGGSTSARAAGAFGILVLALLAPPMAETAEAQSALRRVMDLNRQAMDAYTNLVNQLRFRGRF